MNCEHLLTGCQAFMRHATCHFLIGFCTGSKRRFVFRASLTYITHFSSLISTLFSQNILSECHRQPCQSTPSNICTRQLYNRRLSVTQSGEYLLLFFPSLAFCAYILLDLHTRQSLLDLSILGFVVNCRQCLVRQVISQ